MGTINVTLGDATELNLLLGQQLENEVNEVVFDFSAWKTAYGSGDIDLSVQRHGDAMPYPVTLTVSGTDATWTITDTDTACKGIGEAQVTYKVGDVVKKSVVYKFTVYRSIGENGEYPAPGSTWCDQVEQDIADIKADLAELEGGSVPSNVRQALKTLLESAAYADTGLTDEMAVISSWASQVTAITLNQSSISISGATTSQLTATTTPSGGTVTWSSSDTSVATVSSSGLVTGVSNGTATITASSGTVSATCAVTVSGIATLSSISAAYTQTGTIHDTDSLNDILTAGTLVVTATYDDTSTATIPNENCTLSGTLTTGTSTITVSYSGKTTTFNVAVTHEASTYIQNGLVMWMDGEKNSSGGTHSSSLSTWVDQSGNDWNWTAKSGIIVGDKYIEFDASSTSNLTRSQNSLPQNVVFMEIVMAYDRPSYNGYEAMLSGFGSDYPGNITRNKTKMVFHTGTTAGDSTQFAFSADTNPHYYNSLGYIDGNIASDVASGGDDWIYTHPRIGCYGGSGGTQSQYTFDGKIYCIRLYSRVLTSEEIASNYAVDVSRFGLGI